MPGKGWRKAPDGTWIPPNQMRHTLEIEEDTREWMEETLARFTDKRTYGKTSRVIGAGIAAAGIYTMVRLINQFGRGIGEGIANIQKDIFLNTSIPVINFFTSIFGIEIKAAEEPPLSPEEIEALKAEKKMRFKDGGVGTTGLEGTGRGIQGGLTILEELGQFDPFAFGAALTAGGMVLAGLNPGEILKGIGSIIDALIPL